MATIQLHTSVIVKCIATIWRHMGTTIKHIVGTIWLLMSAKKEILIAKVIIVIYYLFLTGHIKLSLMLNFMFVF